jgi:hypothetical protein
LENGAQVTIFDGIVEYNTARLGGGGVALYVEDQETRFTATSIFDEQAGRMRCSGSVECNLFRNNEAYDGATPAAGRGDTCIPRRRRGNHPNPIAGHAPHGASRRNAFPVRR